MKICMFIKDKHRPPVGNKQFGGRKLLTDLANVLKDKFEIVITNELDEIDGINPDMVICCGYFMPNSVEENLYFSTKTKYQWIYFDANPLSAYYDKKALYRITLDYGTESKFLCDGDGNNRWNKLGITVKPWRIDGDGKYIIIFSQRIVGYNTYDCKIEEWIGNTIVELRKYTNRPIIIRPKPNYKVKLNLNLRKLANVLMSSEPSLTKELQGAWATIGFCTTASITSVIEGIPAFTGHINTFGYDILNKDLKDIESPILHNREKTLYGLANCLLREEELFGGEFAKCLEQLRDK